MSDDWTLRTLLGNFADPVPVTPAPLLPIPGTPQPPDPLGGFRGLQPTPAAVTPGPAGESRFIPTPTPPTDLPPDTIYYESFDGYVPQAYWVGDVNAVRRSDTTGGFLVLDHPGQGYAPIHGRLDPVELRATIRLLGGTLILGVRASGEGSYEASISSSGQVELRRGGQVIGHTSTSAVQTGKSIRIALRAAGADIAVDIDGTTVLTAADPDPLPPGTTYLGSGHASAGQIHVDDVLLAGVRIVVDDNPGEITVIHTDGLSMRSGSPVVAFNAGGQLLTLDSPADQPVVRWGTSIIGHAAWSPDGSKIALTSNDNGDYDIALFDVSTGALTIYPRAGTGDSMPAWSPDGSQIVFVSTSTSSCQMMRLTLSTITFQSLFSGQAFSHPSYSPDSTQVTYGVYVLGYPNNGTILQRRTLSTGQTDGPASAFFADDPEWSPDGSRIAFHVHVEDGGSTVPGGIGLWSLADDSIETRTAQIGDASPTWMSGDELMFVRAGDLYTLNVSPACPAEVPQLYFDAPYTVEFPDWNGTTAAIRTCSVTPEEEYLRSFEGVVFWAVYNETSRNLYVDVPSLTGAVYDHRFLMAMTIIQSIPLFDLSAGMGYMRNWGGSIANTDYDLWKLQDLDNNGEEAASERICIDPSRPDGKLGFYKDMVADSDILRWFEWYAACLRAGGQLANYLDRFDAAFMEITGFIDCAISIHLGLPVHSHCARLDSGMITTNPVSSAYYIKTTSKCFTRGAGQADCPNQRIMQAFCAEQPAGRTDPNRNCTLASSQNPRGWSTDRFHRWLSGVEPGTDTRSGATQSRQQLPLDTALNLNYQTTLGLYTPDVGADASCPNRCYFLLEDHREFTAPQDIVNSYDRHLSRYLNADTGYKPDLPLIAVVHVIKDEFGDGQIGNDMWSTFVFQSR